MISGANKIPKSAIVRADNGAQSIEDTIIHPVINSNQEVCFLSNHFNMIFPPHSVLTQVSESFTPSDKLDVAKLNVQLWCQHQTLFLQLQSPHRMAHTLQHS